VHGVITFSNFSRTQFAEGATAKPSSWSNAAAAESLEHHSPAVGFLAPPYQQQLLMDAQHEFC
jgi:hypothetical protein